MTFPDVIGLFGVALYVGAYAALQLGLLGLSDIRYSALNAVGGIAVIYSLIWSFNLAAFVTQVFWLTFTIIGFIRSRQVSKTGPQTEDRTATARSTAAGAAGPCS